MKQTYFILFFVLFQSCGLPFIKSDTVKPLLLNVIYTNRLRIPDANQIIFVINDGYGKTTAKLYAYEKSGNQWQQMLEIIDVNIGRKGFAEIDLKREGDGKTPSGNFLLGPVFGYEPQIDTKLEYHQSTKDDFWVDDVDSEQYNTWVKGKPNAKSFEKMVLDNDLYKYLIVIQYNTNPIIKGNGSAIFMHVWRDYNKPTAGCVSMSEENIVKLLKWLDPSKKPAIVLGTELDLLSFTK